MTREQIIEKCGFELATNFDCPAAQILRFYGAKLGMSGEQMLQTIRKGERKCTVNSGTATKSSTR
jgi:hypothetical protein